MHALNSAAAFFVASLFFISLYITINAFTLGDKMQADSIETFLIEEMSGANAPTNCHRLCSSQVDPSGCSFYCSTLSEASRPGCLEMCDATRERTDEAIDVCAQNCVYNFNETQAVFSESVDGIYNKSLIYGITIGDITSLFTQKFLFLLLTAVLGIAVLLVDTNPAKRLGGGLIFVAISLLSIVAVPIFVSGGENFALSMLSDYLLDGIILQAIVGISLLAIGIVLEYIGKKKEK